jgi:uncharacterized protein (TIGR03086 family)
MTPACTRTADVLMNISDEQLNGRTPCEKLSLRDLVAHVGGLALAFTAAACKDFGPLTDTPPVEGAPLDEDWRTAYPARLADLARAWREPAAWEGMSRAGGVDFPGEVGGLIALTEVVIHGWDVATATGQDYDVDPATVDAVLLESLGGLRTDAERRRSRHCGRGAAARDRDRSRRSDGGAVRAGGARRR